LAHIVAGSNFALKTVAKQLQIEARLLLTAYKNLSSLYTMVPTHYNVLFSHNICITNDRKTDDRTIGQKPLEKININKQ